MEVGHSSVLPGTTIAPAAETLFQENFNIYSVGSYPTGWYTHDNRPAGTSFGVSDTVIDNGNCLQIIDNQTTDGGWGRKPFSRAAGAGVLEFKVRVQGADSGSATMQHYVYLQDSTNTTGITINMQQNLTGNYWTIGIGTTMNTTTHLAEGTTYTIKVTFNKVNFILDWLQADLYVNNALLLNDQLSLFRMVDRLYVGSTNPTNKSTCFFDSFLVTDLIAGNIIPTISNPPDMVIPPGTSGQSISWIISDPDTLNPTYNVFQNGTLVLTAWLIPWSSGVAAKFPLPTIDPLQTYNFTIVATDGLNATVQDTVFVSTTANNPPVITGIASMSFEYGSQGENLTWTILDNSVNTGASTSQLLRNGSPVASHNGWSNGYEFQYNTTTLGKGTYNFTITAGDGMGGSTSFTTILTIVGDLAPRISSPPDITYQFDSTGNVITWTISDFNMTSAWYDIYRDDVLVSHTTWTSSPVTVNLNVDGLSKGTYVYKIVASDGKVQSIDTVTVIVTNPVLDTLIIILVVAGATLAVIGIIVVKRKKKAGTGGVKRKVSSQGAPKSTKKSTDHYQQPDVTGAKVITCPSCGTPFTLTADYVRQYAGQAFKCTKCQTDIPV